MVHVNGATGLHEENVRLISVWTMQEREVRQGSRERVSFILIHGAFLSDNLSISAWEAIFANWPLV